MRFPQTAYEEQYEAVCETLGCSDDGFVTFQGMYVFPNDELILPPGVDCNGGDKLHFTSVYKTNGQTVHWEDNAGAPSHTDWVARYGTSQDVGVYPHNVTAQVQPLLTARTS